MTRDNKKEYIDALEVADGGNLIPLIELFAKIQRNTLTSALGIAGQVKATVQLSSIIDSIKLELDSRNRNENKNREQVKDMADSVINLAKVEFSNTAEMLKEKLGSFWNLDFSRVDFALNNSERDYYFRSQIVQMAKKYGYYANTNLYKSWCRLTLPGKTQYEILLSAHGIGYEFRGIVVFSACIFSRTKDAEQSELSDFNTLGKDTFQLTYMEKQSDFERRFVDWLNQVLEEGIAIWGKSI